MNNQESNNISEYIQTESDINLFVDTIADLWSKAHTKETDDYWAIFPRQSRQLLWIIAAWTSQNGTPPEQTVENMIKLLDACVSQTKRYEKTAFDILIEDCKIESLQNKYEYFKFEAFGIHSNCYRETVQLCTEVLQELSFEAIADAFKDASKEKEPVYSATELFGSLDGLSGQERQILQYESYALALHEAGHAVAHYILGIDFAGVTIIPTERNAGHLGPAARPPVAIEPRKEAISMYAGAIGEAVALNQSYHSVWGSRNDCRQATEIIKQEVIQELSNPLDAYQYVFIDADVLGLADKESPYIIYETIKRCVEVRQETIELMTANKGMVIALADELLKKQSMPSEEVIQFLDDWQSGNCG